jgi:nicotinic acid phosphoribosyltransferase
MWGQGFNKSVDDDMKFLLDSRLHDFGFRGCTSVEQSVLGGCAHLLNFEGSDTMSACYHAQFHLNGGKPVATSIPATEHSVMTAWPSEEAAIKNEIEHFGAGLFSCVMDSYDYDVALNEVLPKVAPLCQAKKGTMVIRPDSGDPVTQVVKGLKAAEKVFGTKTNGKGFKVIQGAAVIQGDGINYAILRKIQVSCL